MLIFLDLDGTLLDISRRYYRIHRDLCQHFGLTPLPFPVYWTLKRKGASWEELPEDTPASVKKEYWERRLPLLEARKYLAHDRLHPGAKKTIATLGRSHRLVLVTLRHNKPNLHWQLGRLGLEAAFHSILAPGEGNGVGKLELVEKSGWQRGTRALFVGDSEADAQAGKGLGVPICLVSNGIRSPSFLQSLQPTLLVEDITQLPQHLLKI